MFTQKKVLSSLIPIFLIVTLTLSIFWQVQTFEFLNFDDGLYITDNQITKNKFSSENLKVIFTSNLGGHYHPITWLSHNIDVNLYGLNSGKMHLMNLFIHSINAILCFYLLFLLLNNLYTSALIAIIFTIHPMRIESVAWLSERKDVLSTCFGLFSLILYFNYLKNDKKLYFYILSFIFFCLSLLSKPTFVTLPILLLLLEYTKSGRISFRSLFDKIPFIIASSAIAIIVLYTQKLDGGLSNYSSFSSLDRFSNIFSNYIIYFFKFFTPLNLGIFYPFKSIPITYGICACFLFLLINYLIIKNRQKYSLIFLGWIWYSVTLLPLVGIIQIGGQSYADRWSYIPHIGVLVLFFSFLEIKFKKYVNYVAIILTIYFSSITYINLPNWKESESIFRHTLKVSPDNFMAHTNLGNALETKGDLNQAAYHFKEAYRLNSTYPEANNNIGILKASEGKIAEAKNYFLRAVELNPKFETAKYNLSLSYFDLGEYLLSSQTLIQILSNNNYNSQALNSLRYLISNRESNLCEQLNTIENGEKANLIEKIYKFLNIKIC
jgi:tetratricopeptide (TPR) repeat protein